MNTETGNKSHYAFYNREEVIILGYQSSTNLVMFCHIDTLPIEEQNQLRRISSSPDAQNEDFLLNVLNRVQHASGRTWDAYLIERMRRGDGSVLALPLKSLNSMNEDQEAFFKGYGVGKNGHRIRDNELSQMSTLPKKQQSAAQSAAQIGDVSTVIPMEFNDSIIENVSPTVESETNILLKALIESQAKTNEMLSKIVEPKPKSPRKTIATKKTTTPRKKTTNAKSNVKTGDKTDDKVAV